MITEFLWVKVRGFFVWGGVGWDGINRVSRGKGEGFFVLGGVGWVKVRLFVLGGV